MAVVAATHLRAACDRLIVVLRPGSEALVELLKPVDCETVVCPEADAGMGHSLAAGVRAAPEAAGWVVALADMPYISPTSHQAVAMALRAGARLATSEFNGRRGHPVGFAGQWLPELLALTGDHGGKSILAAHPLALVRCPVDDAGVLRDIDRPADI